MKNLYFLWLLAVGLKIFSCRSINSDVCGKVKCDFEKGTACNYTSSFEHESMKDIPQFTLQIESLGTGEFKVPGPDKSKVYLGSVLASGQLSYIISPEFSVSGKREIQFTYYDNTPGIVIKGCLTTETEKCKIIAQGNLNETNWRLGSYTIPPNTKKFGILAHNQGANTGAVGIDNIAVIDC